MLCAGFGTRLGSLCETRPKPLLEVGGAPIAAHILRRLGAHGIRDVIINLHHHADQFAPALGDGAGFGVSISYRFEAEPLGTAGTTRDVLAEASEDLLVHYGDILTDHDLGGLVALHQRRGAAATILVHQRAGSNSHVTIDGEGRVTEFIERPLLAPASAEAPWVFSGICVLAPTAAPYLPPRGACDLPRDVFPSLVKAGQLMAEPLAGYRCAIDSQERLEAARAAFASGLLRPAAPLTAASFS